MSRACLKGMTWRLRFATARSRKSNRRITALKTIQKCMGMNLARAPALAACPGFPKLESLQLVVEMGFLNQVVNLLSVLARPQALRIIGDGKGEIGGYGNVFSQLRQIDFVIGIGRRVVVDQIIRLVLVGNQVG